MNKKVVVIEDDPRNMELFKAVFNTIPYCDLYTETRGRAALTLIESLNPDLIILDIQLPELSGIEICRELRKKNQFKLTPIIAVTAFAMKGDREKIVNAGFNEYVSKPIRIKEFREIIHTFIKPSLNIQE